MFTMPTAPRSIGGVLDDAFQLYRQSFWAVWPLSLLAIVLTLIIVGMASWRAFASIGTPEQALAAFTSVGFWLGALVALALAFWLYGAQLLRANAIAQGESMPFGAALGRGLAITPAMLLATLAYAVVLLIAVVLPGVGAALMTDVWSRVVVAVVLCVPFVVLYVTYYFYLVAIAVDDTGPFTGLGRSRDLVRGNWWRVTAILTVGMIILMVVYFTAGFIAGLIATPIRDVLVNTIVSQILNVALSSAVMPLFPVLSLAIYYDLKLRKFGGDLAQRVDSLA